MVESVCGFTKALLVYPRELFPFVGEGEDLSLLEEGEKKEV